MNTLETGKSIDSNRVLFKPTKRNSRGKKFWKQVRTVLLLVLFLFSFTIGYLGFQKYSAITNRGFDSLSSIYASLELFKFSGGGLAGSIPWELEVARWLSPLLAGYTVVLGAAALFQNQLRMIRVLFFKRHVIICGLGKQGLHLARNFARNGQKVIVIEIDPANNKIATAGDEGAIVIVGDARDSATLKKANLQNASYLICVAGDDGLNSDIAMNASNNLNHRKYGKLNCTIHIEDPRLWVFLRMQELSLKRSDQFRLDFFNIYDQGAKQLLQEYPLHLGNKTDVPPYLIFIGYSSFSEQMILNTARQWSDIFSRTGQKILIDIVDPDADNHIGRLAREFTLVDRTCEFTGYPYAPDSKGFAGMDFLNNHTMRRISRIHINFDNEQIGLSSALSILNHLRNQDVEIVVSMVEEVGLSSLIRENNLQSNKLKHLHFFGLMEKTCIPDLVFNSSLEAIARSIHSTYLKMMLETSGSSSGTPALLPWEQLGEDLKEMNRDQAESMGLKMKSIGCDIIPWTDFGAQDFKFKDDEIEKMARLEHERWTRYKFQQGWKYNPKRDDHKKEHPSLLPWDNPAFPEHEKDKDRTAVRQIPQLVALAGYQIFRLVSPEESEII